MRIAVVFILLCACALAARADDRPLTPAARTSKAWHEKQLQLHPDSATVHFAYAEFLFDEGEMRAAVSHFRVAQMIDPGNAAIANSLGGVYLRMGRAALSAAQFQRAVASASEVAAYHYNLGNVEFLLRRDLTAAWQIETPALLRKALAEYREASRLSPQNMEYARGYAETFYGVPNPDWTEAEAAWKHVLSLSPPQADFANLQLARVSLKLGHKEEARRFLDQIRDVRHDGLKQKLRDQADKL